MCGGRATVSSLTLRSPRPSNRQGPRDSINHALSLFYTVVSTVVVLASSISLQNWRTWHCFVSLSCPRGRRNYPITAAREAATGRWGYSRTATGDTVHRRQSAALLGVSMAAIIAITLTTRRLIRQRKFTPLLPFGNPLGFPRPLSFESLLSFESFF